MKQLLEHVALAMVISALISVGIEMVKTNLKLFTDKEIEGKTLFFLSLIVSLVVSFGYTMYYNQLNGVESVAIYVIVVLGAQGFHQVLLSNKGDE